jgi:hypothetical protein
MSVFTPDQIVLLAEVLSVILGLAIIWAVYYGSENAELPGGATIPERGEADDASPDTSGRTLT